jgi:DNA-binding MarR family transcriptional regulator
MPSPKKTQVRRDAPAASEHFDLQSDSLGYALRRTQIRAYDLFFEKLGALDLSPARLTALSLLSMDAGINQAALAKRLNIAGPSVLKLVDALEQSGFVSRETVEGDRRRYALHLTDLGRERLVAAHRAHDAFEAELAKHLSADERAQLMELLSRLGQ